MEMCLVPWELNRPQLEGLQEVALCLASPVRQWPRKTKSNSVLEKQSLPSKCFYQNWRKTTWSILDTRKIHLRIWDRKQSQVQNEMWSWHGLMDCKHYAIPKQAVSLAITVSLGFDSGNVCWMTVCGGDTCNRLPIESVWQLSATEEILPYSKLYTYLYIYRYTHTPTWITWPNVWDPLSIIHSSLVFNGD